MHKAILYKKLKNNNVRCIACKQYCVIAPDHTGICGVRQNKKGDLYLIVYAKASAVNVDPIEKKPLYHFLPGSSIFSIGTVGCNFACRFCQNWDLSQVTKDLRFKLLKEKKPANMDMEVGAFGYELSPQKIVNTCLKENIPSIAYTYNEPTIFFEYLFDTAKLAKGHGLKNMLVSNGYISREALDKAHKYIDAINVDLKSFRDEFYKTQCSAQLKPVLDTIKSVHKLGIFLEVTTLVIPGKNDSDRELADIAKFLAGIDKSIPWHISAFYPHYKMQDVSPTGHEILIRAHNIGKRAGLQYVYVGNIIDEERSRTKCPKCDTILITRHGYSVEIMNMKNGKCLNCREKIAGVWK